MKSKGKPHMNKYKKTVSDWNYATTCMLISVLVFDLQDFKH